ncbi:MAG: diaminopimelate epimerase [Acidimicrobiales bacterium]
MNTSGTAPHRLALTKHHGAGNDFLVLVDPDGCRTVDAPLVRALCDRRFGVGADGLIRVSVGGDHVDLAMDLRNADGGVAEMSGNGMRCLAQAAVDAGLVRSPVFTVATLAGVRSVEYRPGGQAGAAEASVEMGGADLGPAQDPGQAAERARLVATGNPHLVLLVPDPAEAAVAELGRQLQMRRVGGINVEFIAAGPERDAITLRVWERGVGETLACGTGSVAAAAAARSWGLVGDAVDVHNPGGTLQVAFEDGGARLRGPVRKVANLEVDVSEVLGAARP